LPVRAARRIMGGRTQENRMSESASPARIFRFSEIGWERPEEAAASVGALAQRGWEQGARRKRMARGESGFHLEHSYLPPGFEVPPHSHGHDELLIVLEGACQLSDGRWLTDYDAVTVPANQAYGFKVGPIGLRFVVVRGGASQTRLQS
jgi:mannose-6-phosphate isomerase-like protein (cupin superfamily)